jgi:hypothetical protein
VFVDIGLLCCAAEPPVFIEYDLGQSFALTDLVIWNDNEPNWAKQGIKGATVEVREHGGPPTTVFTGDIPIAPAEGTGPTTASIAIDLTGQTARFIRITSDASPNHSWRFTIDGTASDFAVGISEVRVYGDPTGLGNTNTVQACCFFDTTCQDMEPADCTTAGGTPQAPGSECLGTVCPNPPEACCLSDGTCQDLLTTVCAGISGTSQGVHTCSFADCVAATMGTGTNVVANDIDDFIGVTYNVQRATSLNPNSADADPSFHVGDGGTATLVSGRADPNAFYRYGSDAALVAVGNPNSNNGWDTTSEVSARASSQTGHPRPAIGLINGAGIAANGTEHENNPPTHLMWMTTQDLGADRFAATPDGVWVEFNLGSAKVISDMLIWNYAESAPGGWTTQGMKDCQIFYTTVGGGAALPPPVTDPNAGWGSDDINDWTQVGGSGNVISLNRADTLSSAGHIGVTDTFGINDTAQYVLILGADDPTNANHTGGSNADVGLSEVRFVLTDQPSASRALTVRCTPAATRPFHRTCGSPATPPVFLQDPTALRRTRDRPRVATTLPMIWADLAS